MVTAVITGSFGYSNGPEPTGPNDEFEPLFPPGLNLRPYTKTATATRFVVEYTERDDGVTYTYREEFTGSGFRYDSKGRPIAGEITSTLSSDNDGSVSITGLKLSFATFMAVQSGAAYNRMMSQAMAGNDVLRGGNGDDDLYGFAGNDLIRGGGDDDYLFGGAGNDTLYGDAGNDALNGGAGNDRLFGGAGSDGLLGGAGRDTLYGDAGNDRLFGDAGDDLLFGGAGADRLDGGAGRDRLVGGAGKDVLTGGGGADTFVFATLADSKLVAATRDLITDFNQGQKDRIDVSGIDANSRQTGNQAFDFIESSAFSGNAGELRQRYVGQQTIIEGDVNGDRRADFSIALDGRIILTDSDFIL